MTPDKKTLAKLAAAALKARDNAYAPYSDHPVGAAVLSGSGKIYAGANVEVANYDATCAENAAIAAMTSAGDRTIRAIVTVGPSPEYLCTPCGRCRQRIREFSDKDTRIHALHSNGAFGRVYSINDLLPDSFGPENLAVFGKGPKAKNKKKAARKK